MKYTVHVPVEQYGFISAEWEGDDPKASYEAYNAIAGAFKPAPVNSLPDKEFNNFIDEMLKTKKIVNGQEAYEKMSPQQKDIIQSVKRSFKRLGN